MKGCPAREEVEPILMIAALDLFAVHHLHRFLHQEEGVRETLTANILSNSSCDVFSRLPRSVSPAALTRMSMRPRPCRLPR